MVGVRLVLQRVDDEHIKAFKLRQRIRPEIAHIGTIGERTDAEGQRVDQTVLLRQRQKGEWAPCSVDHKRLVVLNTMRREYRRVFAAFRRLETIEKAFSQPDHCGVIRIDVHALALYQNIAAQVVNAMDMVSMRMRVDGGIERRDAIADHLLAEIRSRIDDDAGSRAVWPDPLHKGRSAQPAVTRIGWIAGAPVAHDARHAG